MTKTPASAIWWPHREGVPHRMNRRYRPLCMFMCMPLLVRAAQSRHESEHDRSSLGARPRFRIQLICILLLVLVGRLPGQSILKKAKTAFRS